MVKIIFLKQVFFLTMDINNQKEYWDKVAWSKTFTHPLDEQLLGRFVSKNEKIVDYGCGYGRVVEILTGKGYSDVTGFDTSMELINRGVENTRLKMFHINDPADLPASDNSVHCILLFAVLTCIPSNKGQSELIDMLYSKLKTGGILYVSDYYLQDNLNEVGRYEYLNDDADNFGVFTLPEGVTFRHHTKECITTLLRRFSIREEIVVEVKTMNGSAAKAFQMIAQKQNHENSSSTDNT